MQPTVTRDDRYDQLRLHAVAQRGMFTTAQANACGFGYESIRTACARGRWAEIEPGVFRSASAPPLAAVDQLCAAALSADALAARQSALALGDLATHARPPQLLVVRSRRNLDRVRLHSTRSLPIEDQTVIAGIATTTAVRATIDAAARLPEPLTRRVITKAIVHRRYRVDDLVIRAAELVNSRRPGARRVLQIVAGLHPNLVEARNEWEALVAELAQRYGLPRPEFNVRVELPLGPRYVDCGWVNRKRGMEYDGYWEHLTSTRRFDDDRFRQIEFHDAGWVIDHCTHRMLRKDPERVFGPLRRAFEAEPVGRRPRG